MRPNGIAIVVAPKGPALPERKKYSAIGGAPAHREPDADEAGGPPDADADDPMSRMRQGAGPAPSAGAGANPGASANAGMGGKVSTEEAACYTGEVRCSNCANYLPQNHQCQKVDGANFGTEIVGCVRYFTPEGGNEMQNPMDAGAPMHASMPMHAPAPVA